MKKVLTMSDEYKQTAYIGQKIKTKSLLSYVLCNTREGTFWIFKTRGAAECTNKDVQLYEK